MTDPDSSEPLNDETDAIAPESLRALLRQAAPSRFEAGFDDRVMARLASAPGRSAPRTDEVLANVSRRWLPWLAAAAAMLAIIDWRTSVSDRRDLSPAVANAGDSAIPDWSAYQ